MSNKDELLYGASISVLAQNAASQVSTIIGGTRLNNTYPSRYRLLQKKDGTVVLQGDYYWIEGPVHGYEWCDIPTEQE